MNWTFEVVQIADEGEEVIGAVAPMKICVKQFSKWNIDIDILYWMLKIIWITCIEQEMVQRPRVSWDWYRFTLISQLTLVSRVQQFMTSIRNVIWIKSLLTLKHEINQTLNKYI